LTSVTIDEIKKNTVKNLYRFSDLSIQGIAEQLDLDETIVQQLVDGVTKEDALEVMIEQSTTNIQKIMTPVVVSMDCSQSPREAARLMSESEIGSILVTRNGKPFGIVTQSDIVRWAGMWPNLLNASLEGLASTPLIVVGRGASVEMAAKIMIANRVHKLPVIEDEKIYGIITITDLASFLSPSRRPGLALSVLQAISRGYGIDHDH